MLRGYYTAAAGMIAEQRRQEMLTNNLANTNTPGYKADQTSFRSFPSMLLETMGGNPGVTSANNPIGSLNTGVYMQEATPDFSQGPINSTGQSTDMALVANNLPKDPKTGEEGTLFFTVQMPDGSTSYTKNGHFSVDQNGYLTNDQGNYILNTQNKPIQVNGTNFSVDATGLIRENGKALGQLNIAYAATPTQLVKQGNDLYHLTTTGGKLPSIQQANLPVGTTMDVKQGFLEQSNVSAEQTVTDMMMALRSFGANQKVLQTYDQSMTKTVNEVGKVG